MDDTREDSKYVTNYALNQGHNVPYTQSSQIAENYVEEEEEDDEVEEDDEAEEQEQEQEQEETNVGDNEINGSTQQNGDNDDNHHHHQYDDINDDDDDDDDNNNLQRHPKKRKLKSLLSSYEFAPRVPPPPPLVTPISTSKPSFGGRNTLTDWSEHETFVLLEAWGDRFLQCGRKSLRSEEWQEVADRVSQDSKIERTDSQCRNRLDTLKKKYKKEKANLEGKRGVNTKWVYFKKMDMLLSSNNLSRGVVSEENLFINPNLNTPNGVDDTRGNSGNSDSDDDDDDDDSDLLPPKKLKSKSKSKADKSGGSSFGLLADSINKFSDIYEKIENSKIQQMIELEKMRMEFHRDLEMQKRKILDRAQVEITKVRRGDYEENDVSAENVSG